MNLLSELEPKTRARILEGDCLDVLKTLDSESIEAVVTDPPYGLSKEPDIAEVLTKWLAGEDYAHRGEGFMGKSWDSFVPGPSVWREVYRVLKPGGHALVFAGTRTQDLMGISLRFAGFQIIDTLQWVFGQGFPKSHNVEKSLRKLDENEAADTFTGYGSALKPAHEPIVLCRKPLSESSIARNVLEHGTGALNIDESRVGNVSTVVTHRADMGFHGGLKAAGEGYMTGSEKGRFPANLMLSHSPGCRRIGEKKVKDHKIGHRGDGGIWGNMKAQKDGGHSYAGPDGTETVEAYECAPGCPVAALDEQSGESKSPKTYKRNANGYNANSYGNGMGESEGKESLNFGDSGGASRFFKTFEPDTDPGFYYCPKASKAERNAGLEGMEEKPVRGGGSEFGKMTMWNGENGDEAWRRKNPNKPAANHHPTVKPTKLMRYLVRLITPPSGTCLDPFAGSGSTGVACAYEGFDFIGIEMDTEYAEIARRRIAHAQETC